jgi:perosamine synthetase
MNLQNLKADNREQANKNSLEVCNRFHLVPVGSWVLKDSEIIRKITAWRKKTMLNFFSEFDATEESTSSYLRNFSISQSNRILFLLQRDEDIVGHMGLSSVSGTTGEIDNVMKTQTKSEAPSSSEMLCILQSLVGWATSDLGLKLLRLQVKEDNIPAISLYKKAGFKVMSGHSIQGEIVSGQDSDDAQKRVWMERVEYD